MPEMLLSLALSIGAPALKENGPADLYGDWDSADADGETGGPAYRFRFNKDGTWQVFRGGKEVNGVRGFRFDPKKSPAEIDLNSPPGPKTPLVLGIYKIEGDRLALCEAEPGQPRPTKFKGPDSGGKLRYLHRAKAKD